MSNRTRPRLNTRRPSADARPALLPSRRGTPAHRVPRHLPPRRRAVRFPVNIRGGAAWQILRARRPRRSRGGRTTRSSAPRADDLNDRALALLGLGRTEDAAQALAEALTADPRHPQATFNAGLLRWRAGALTDEGLPAEIEALRQDLADPGEADRFAALVHLERGDPASAGAPPPHGDGTPADTRRQVPWRARFPSWITPDCTIEVSADLRAPVGARRGAQGIGPACASASCGSGRTRRARRRPRRARALYV
ncbi:tetratricopeptide repeat protein [Kitasatospora sp. NPDC048722]|uniref:tetratricopeptide repeat protein n=1 Tax=Kitasatospora sp. NPDC048722 TaxID=3155639 RepID=UPI0033EE053C